MPLPVKPVPVMVICETVTFALPVLVRTRDCELLLPTVTLPKAKLLWLTDNVRTCAAMPVPANETVGFVGELLPNEICPEALPTAVGANCAV